MRNSRARLGLHQIVVFVFLFSFALCAIGLPWASGHSGENEAFSGGEGSSGPKEVSVDEQGIRALEIKTAKVRSQHLKESLKATGDVQADETRAFNVNPPVTGVVKAVLAKQGDVVRAGQVLAVVHSVEVASSLRRA